MAKYKMWVRVPAGTGTTSKRPVQKTIDEVQTDIDNGSEFYLLDGQNRLFEALAILAPFFVVDLYVTV